MKSRCKMVCNNLTTSANGTKAVQLGPVAYTAEAVKAALAKGEDIYLGGGLTLQYADERIEFKAGKEYYLDLSEA